MINTLAEILEMETNYHFKYLITLSEEQLINMFMEHAKQVNKQYGWSLFDFHRYYGIYFITNDF